MPDSRDVLAEVRAKAEDRLAAALASQWHRTFGDDVEPSAETDWFDPGTMHSRVTVETCIDGYACDDGPVVWAAVFLGQRWLDLFGDDPEGAVIEDAELGTLFVLDVDHDRMMPAFTSAWVPRIVPVEYLPNGRVDDWIVISDRLEVVRDPDGRISRVLWGIDVPDAATVRHNRAVGYSDERP